MLSTCQNILVTQYSSLKIEVTQVRYNGKHIEIISIVATIDGFVISLEEGYESTKLSPVQRTYISGFRAAVEKLRHCALLPYDHFRITIFHIIPFSR
mmetsp:Transcript_23586/g.34599  ORF Transcript_23586/g.34599 Transcript_23586/m.34599 type:complete len:97 (+) Transcript_23586:108-398(+)